MNNPDNGFLSFVMVNSKTDGFEDIPDPPNIVPHLIIPTFAFDSDVILSTLALTMDELALESTVIENWIVLQRKHFDFMLEDEPFRALSLLIDIRNGIYIHRLFGKNLEKKQIKDYNQIVKLVVDSFKCVVPCLGFNSAKLTTNIDTNSSPVSQTRFFSKTCLKTFKSEVTMIGVGMCLECQAIFLGRNYMESCHKQLAEPLGFNIKSENITEVSGVIQEEFDKCEQKCQDSKRGRKPKNAKVFRRSKRPNQSALESLI